MTELTAIRRSEPQAPVRRFTIITVLGFWDVAVGIIIPNGTFEVGDASGPERFNSVGTIVRIGPTCATAD